LHAVTPAAVMFRYSRLTYQMHVTQPFSGPLAPTCPVPTLPYMLLCNNFHTWLISSTLTMGTEGLSDTLVTIQLATHHIPNRE